MEETSSDNFGTPIEIDQSALDELAKTGISLESLMEAKRRQDSVKDKRRTRLVCICGHTNASHKTSSNGSTICMPNARQCHCGVFRAVLETTNLTVFKRFSRGNGEDHALLQGVAGIMEKGGTLHWLPNALTCAVCKRTPNDGVKIIPVVVTEGLQKAEAHKDRLTDRLDIFLCIEDNEYLQAHGNLAPPIRSV